MFGLGTKLRAYIKVPRLPPRPHAKRGPDMPCSGIKPTSGPHYPPCLVFALYL
jgi:hypothetical protein